jgi:hypothetical protein
VPPEAKIRKDLSDLAVCYYVRLTHHCEERRSLRPNPEHTTPPIHNGI